MNEGNLTEQEEYLALIEEVVDIARRCLKHHKRMLNAEQRELLTLVLERGTDDQDFISSDYIDRVVGIGTYVNNRRSTQISKTIRTGIRRPQRRWRKRSKKRSVINRI